MAELVTPNDQSFVVPSVIAAEIARVLADEIVFLKLQPGHRIVEEELCARYGVSRSPVREALKVLEAEGLIIRSARRGARVAPMNKKDLVEVYACRSALLGVAAAGAAENATKADRSELARLLAILQDAYSASDVQGFFAATVSLTSAIYASCGNETLLRIVAGVEKQALRYRYLAHIRTTEMQEASFSGFKEISDAIISKNSEQARHRAEIMICRAHDVIARTLDMANPSPLTFDRTD